MIDREKVIKGLECCTEYCDDETGCPYSVYEADGFECQEKLREDAIALLKEQMPRVMTLDEITDEYCDYVFVEDISDPEYEYLLYAFPYGHDDIYVYMIMQDSIQMSAEYMSNSYNKTWRCWNTRPTDEQRVAEPWRQ